MILKILSYVHANIMLGILNHWHVQQNWSKNFTTFTYIEFILISAHAPISAH